MSAQALQVAEACHQNIPHRPGRGFLLWNGGPLQEQFIGGQSSSVVKCGSNVVGFCVPALRSSHPNSKALMSAPIPKEPVAFWATPGTALRSVHSSLFVHGGIRNMGTPRIHL